MYFHVGETERERERDMELSDCFYQTCVISCVKVQEKTNFGSWEINFGFCGKPGTITKAIRKAANLPFLN